MKNKNTTLTASERLILTLMFEDASGNGHDFGIIENLKNHGIDMKQARGVISSLVKKDILTVDDYRFEMGMERGCTQFTWNHAGDMHGVYPETIEDLFPKELEVSH
jgi:hypothetical protein